MCGRFTLRTPTPVLVKTFRIDQVDGLASKLTPRFNVAPTQDVAVVRDQNDQRSLTTMRWGLIPFWAKDTKIGSRMINARCETIAVKPAFRNAFGRRRCLILADGYYEWKREGSKKQPYWIHMDDDRPFSMAGLWESWTDKSVESPAPLHSCTIITTDSNDLTRDLHDRMPVILESDDWDLWLDTTVDDTPALHALLKPYESDAMTMEPVSTFVNNSRNEGSECIAVQRELF